MTIDNGNHLLLSGNHAALDYLRGVGAEDRLIGPPTAEFRFADVAGGEFISIVGPSGCGKSTLLRIVAGLIASTTGACDRARNATAAFVFQDAALLPWRTVNRNAELLMELERVPATERNGRAAEALRLVGLAGFERSYQGSAVVVRWPLELAPGDGRSFEMRFRVRSAFDRLVEELGS